MVTDKLHETVGTVEELSATPTPDLTRFHDARHIFPMGVEYVRVARPIGGYERRSTLAEVAAACGRELPERIASWPASPDGDAYVATEGCYLPTLAGELLRDYSGAALRFPTAAEAIMYAERRLMAPLRNVWVRLGYGWEAETPASWRRGVAGPGLGLCPTICVPRTVVLVSGAGVRGRALSDARIRERVVEGAPKGGEC